MTPQDQQQQIQSVGGDTVRDQDKIQIVLAYLSCLCLIPLLTVKDSEYVKWHAKQGLVLMIAGILVNLLHVIPIVGNLLACVASLAIFVCMIMGIVKGLGGQRWRIPVIADLSEKFNI